MTPHVDPETLALFAEGLLDEDEEQAVRARLAESAEARAQLAALTEVSQLLAAAPVPPMPDGLVARIDEALRAESEQRAASAGGTGHGTGDTDTAGAVTDGDGPGPPGDTADVLPFRRKNGPTRWLPYLAAAAAAVFVLGAGAAVLNGVLSPANDSQTASDAPAATPLEEAEPDVALSYHPVVVYSGTDYGETALAEQGASVVERSVFGFGAAPETNEENPETAPLPGSKDLPAEVSSCVQALRGADEETADGTGADQPTLIDMATYEGEPAWVMFFPISEGPDAEGYELRVVAPDCAEGDPTAATITSAVVPVR